MKNFSILLMILLLAAAFVGCGGDDAEDEPVLKLAEGELTAGELLPASRSGMRLQEMQIIDEETQLQSYAGALAEEMYLYGLVGIASALYESDTTQFSVEIAQFDTSLNAYGYYSRTRPANADLIDLGTEGYINGNSLYFAQGPYYVTVSAFDTTETLRDRLQQMAVMISAESGIGPGSIPRRFLLFPGNNQIPTTNRYYAQDYLGLSHLDGVYTFDYAFAGDTATLFLTPDDEGSKFIALSDFAQDVSESPGTPEGIAFDEDYGLMFVDPDPTHGRIAAGLKNGQLVGIVGYSEAVHQQFLNRWVSGLE